MSDNKRPRTSMTVQEMGKLLGLGKTGSYWLIKKGYFKVITVGSKMRVMIDSFEDWYSHQARYKKTDGTVPGSALKQNVITVSQLGDMLGISEASAYELIAKGYFDIVPVLGKRCVSKDSFEQWYKTQSSYITRDDLQRQSEILEATYSMPELREMLHTHRNNILYLVSSNKVASVKVGRQVRVFKDSFFKWLDSQSTYKIDNEGSI